MAFSSIRQIALPVAVLFLVAALFVMIGSLAPAARADTAPKKTGDRANIIVLMTDDEDAGSTLSLLPNIQSFIKQGTNFTNAFVVNPVCCASRATFLSGQYSHNDNVWSNGEGPRPGGFGAFTNDANALPVWLQQSGYYTGMIGKYLNNYGVQNPNYVPPGWNVWNGLVDPTTYRYYDYTFNENGNLVTYGEDPSDYQTDVISNKVVNFIDSQASSTQPFFLWVTGIAPHWGSPGGYVPTPPPRYVGYFSGLTAPQGPSFNEKNISDKPQFFQDNMPRMNKKAINAVNADYEARAETMLGVDDMVGRVMDELQATGKLDSTYVVFVSDNGYFNGEHRLPNSKYLLYDESIRVPLAIRGPGVPAGQTRSNLVANIDLPATIIDIAGATAGRSQDGKSILPIITDPNAPWRTGLLVEGLDELPGHGLNGEGGVFGYYAGIRTPDYLYAEHVGVSGTTTMATEFYDLTKDPYELQSQQNNKNYRATVKTLSGQLATYETCAGKDCFITKQEPPKDPAQPPVPPDIGAPDTGTSWYDTVNFGGTPTDTEQFTPIAKTGVSVAPQSQPLFAGVFSVPLPDLISSAIGFLIGGAF
jgi:arylsulfatase A-like enzyme